MKTTDLAQAERIDTADAVTRMRAGQLDGAFFTVGGGSGLVRDLLADGRAKLVAVPWTQIARMRVKLPFYWLDDIPAGTYPGQTAAVPTPSLRVLLVTTENAEAGAVYGLTRALVDNLPALRRLTRRRAACRRTRYCVSSRSPPSRRSQALPRAKHPAVGGESDGDQRALEARRAPRRTGPGPRARAPRRRLRGDRHRRARPRADGHGRSAAARAGQELVAPGALVALAYVHSTEGRPVRATFRVEADRTLRLIETVPQRRAGAAALGPAGTWAIEGGEIVARGESAPVAELRLRVVPLTRHRLVLPSGPRARAGRPRRPGNAVRVAVE